ncbi:hypothetical protein BH23ACT8_BH23ACT8_23620 [soil metagenome]
MVLNPWVRCGPPQRFRRAGPWDTFELVLAAEAGTLLVGERLATSVEPEPGEALFRPDGARPPRAVALDAPPVAADERIVLHDAPARRSSRRSVRNSEPASRALAPRGLIGPASRSQVDGPHGCAAPGDIPA